MALVAKFPKCWVFSDEIYSQLTYDGETALAGAALFHSYASGQAKIIYDLV
jgi:aspartate/methionine/tyrosine aminotransferase